MFSWLEVERHSKLIYLMSICGSLCVREERREKERGERENRKDL